MKQNISKENLQEIFDNQNLNLKNIQEKVFQIINNEKNSKPLISLLTKGEVSLLSNKTLFPTDIFANLIRDNLKNHLLKEYRFIDNDILTLVEKGESLLFVVFNGVNIILIDNLNKNFKFIYNDNINELLKDKDSIENEIELLNQENFLLSKEFLNTRRAKRKKEIEIEKETIQYRQAELQGLLELTFDQILEEKENNKKEIEIQDIFKQIFISLTIIEESRGI